MSHRTTKSAQQRRGGVRQRWACCHLAAGSSPLCSFVFWSSCGNFFVECRNYSILFNAFFPGMPNFLQFSSSWAPQLDEKRELRRSCDVVVATVLVATRPFLAAPQLEEKEKSKNILIES